MDAFFESKFQKLRDIPTFNVDQILERNILSDGNWCTVDGKQSM